MAPIINKTYGKKKRLGLPKYVRKEVPEASDLFDKLNVKAIKKIKANADTKKKTKSSKKTSQVKVWYPRQDLSHHANSTFDKLLKDGPVQNFVPSLNQSTSMSHCSQNVSNSFDFSISNTHEGSVAGTGTAKASNCFGLAKGGSIIHSNKEVFKPVSINTVGSLSSIEIGNSQQDLNEKNSPVCFPKQKPYFPISPIEHYFPPGSTSTPCGLGLLRPSTFSQGASPHLNNLSIQLADEVFKKDLSADLFDSCDRENNPSSEPEAQNKSVDLFSSFEPCPSNKLRYGNVPNKTDICDINVAPTFNLVNRQQCLSDKSCIVPVSSSNSDQGCINCSQDGSMNDFDQNFQNAHCPKECADNAELVDNISQFVDILTISSSDESSASDKTSGDKRPSSLSFQNLKTADNPPPDSKEDFVASEKKTGTVSFPECRIFLERCDVKPALDVSVENSFIASSDVFRESVVEESIISLESCNAPSEEVCGRHSILSRSSEPSKIDGSAVKTSGISCLKECRVMLTPCDASKPIAGVVNQQQQPTASEVALDTPSLSPCLNSDSLRRSSIRKSANPDKVVLRPGKQWRRSLSIVSKVQPSNLGDMSTLRSSPGILSSDARKSLFPVDTRIKGRLWETAVNSIIKLQPEIISEDREDSKASNLSSNGDADSQSIVELSFVHLIERESNFSTASQIYRRCKQDGPVSFSEYYPESMKKSCKKIGEGVYGEVFFYSGSSKKPPAVIKVIPIEGNAEVNGEPQKTFGEILSEVCVAQELSQLREGSQNVAWTFNEVQAVRCIQGRYPSWLQDLWNDFDEAKGSENDSPEMFLDDQLYIVLELSHGGQDLESFVFSSADQGLAALKQVALTLAVGERALSFEHRDLHWGNILISNTKKKNVKFVLDGETISTPSKGIEVSVIDFTLSRINDPDTSKPIFYDLSRDETLFTAQGDYQFDIYRLMKDYCGNKWDSFTPKTNIAWLHYLLDKLSTLARYKNRSSRAHKSALDTLLEMRDTVMFYPDVPSFVKCAFFH